MTESSHVFQIKAETKIQNKFSTVRAQKIELRQLRTQLRDTFSQDKTYHDLDELTKDQKKKLEHRKKELEDKNPAIGTLKGKIETLKEGVKSEQLTLSAWLIEYKETTKNETIPDDNGEIVKIEVKKIAKTVKI